MVYHPPNKTSKRGIQTHRKTQKKHPKFLNCSPAVKGKTPVSGSCFTPSVLHKLKTSYNKHHPQHKIEATEPAAIWHELKDRMNVCTKEDCWLHVIDSKQEQKKLDQYLFAPDQPAEWRNKPNEWLSNFDIMAVLRQYEQTHPNFKLIGPTPIDFDDRPQSMNGQCVWKDLCSFDLKKWVDAGKTKIGIVFNLDKHDGPGSHWVSLFVDVDDQYLFYLDSAGQRIPARIQRLVKKIQKQSHKKMTFHQNYPVVHQKGNTECGMYSLYFLITLLTGETESGHLNTAKEKIRFFKGKRIPDGYIQQFRNIYYNP